MTPKAPQLPEISGYTMTEQLYLGSRTAVYRAVRDNQDLPVVIKVLQREYPTFGELVQFSNQYAIAKNLTIAGIIQPLSLEIFGNGYALVMPDWGGISLEKYIQDHQLDLTEKLKIAIQIADILHELHQHRVIHKDIKPANILIHPESQQVKLIDFSIASLLPKETQEIKNPNVLEGTLAYLAPEQTGRMNRGIDYRSDFYATGVTLYQLLTGSLPFISQDPLELVHCHIAKMAIAVHEVNTDIPKMLGAIVGKLMAKNAEDRYQSALGLKHDLGECLNQNQETGLITEFDLGQRDLCDRFLIPEKLYGRETEVQVLLDAFDRVAAGTTELMLVAGFSGIGKTAVINEVHKPIVRQRGYFIKGKFDQFNRNIPFSAFLQAFRDLVGQLFSESDAQLQVWKTQILQALGDNAQVIIELIPELERIIGTQPPAPELSGTAAQNRFNLLFQKFIQVFTQPQHPLVIFIDDLQWAESASLNLIQVLMAEMKTGYLLLLGAYRDNEVFAAHPLMLTLEGIEKAEATINTITLQALNHTSLNHLIADTLHAQEAVVEPLTELVMQKTQGNPFFATQFLKALHQDQLITFNYHTGYWQCDIVQVRNAALTDDVVEFMAMQLQKLPTATQDVLKLAACIGAQFDLATLAIISEREQGEVATALWKALQEGLVLPQSNIYKFYLGDREATQPKFPETLNYKFLHDRVQQAAYSLIPENHKQITHWQIGKLLLNNTPVTKQDEILFEILNHLNIGKALITDPVEQLQLVKLNLSAGIKAKTANAYAAAVTYSSIGLESLPANSWQDYYQLTLSLHHLMTESLYLAGDFERMENYAAVTLKHCQELLEKVPIYNVQIQACMAQSRHLEALALALGVLERLGVKLPNNPSQSDFDQSLEQTQRLLLNKTTADLLELPLMRGRTKLAAMQLLSSIGSTAYQAAPALFRLIVLQQVQLSIIYGNAPESACVYATYGLLLSGVLGDINAGYELGELALQLIERLNAVKLKSKTLFSVNCWIRHWKDHLKETLNPLLEAYTCGLETGDFDYAMMSAYVFGRYAYLCGQELDELSQLMMQYGAVMRQLKQMTYVHFNGVYHQSVLNLLGATENPCLLVGESYDELKMLPLHRQANQTTIICHVHFCKLTLCYLFAEYAQALENAAIVEQYLASVTGLPIIPIFYFYKSLTQLALYTEVCASEQASILETVTQNQMKLEQWAKFAPSNYFHKFALMQAEKCRILGQKQEAIDEYDRAIAAAKANGYIQEEALANELAAKFYLNWGKEKVAAGYMQEAYYCYSRWRAKAKIDDLQQHYPHLLRPILQTAEVSGGTWNTLMTISPFTTSVYSSKRKSSSSTSINQTLDFAAILKASQALSSTIELDQLLHQLTQIILQNSGGNRCGLLLPNERGEWQLRAISTLDGTQLFTEPLTNHSHLPVKLIQYVKNTQATVVIDGLKTDLPVIDDYLIERQPKSLLCLPLLNQGQLIGILYLKNHSTIGAFTSDRVEVLNLLCTQVAISLENARLYQKAQEYAQQLEQSQLQIVQSEKMASLGNLVAGVAHEINNPIGFLNGSINNSKEYVQDLLRHLALYQQHYPHPVEAIQDNAENIDLEFISEDLPKLLDAMKGTTNRIKNISNSLRIFSRADTENKIRANLHQGLDSTLLILKYRLKANEHRPAIQVIQDLGDLPTIECFPGQLNQVFMNILANAIDMFDEMAQTQSFKELEANPQKITIRTEVISNQVYIRIRDNGKGMTQELQGKIFDHLFTTKAVGKGTGLGLAIARQIVVEKHGGSLNVWSELGQGTEFCVSLPIGSK